MRISDWSSDVCSSDLLAIIFERMGISTRDVLAAAGTKWNFLPFSPGLVGGHCIGVDPYYLTAKAEEVGYNPEVILSGRRINDGMGSFIAGRVVKMLGQTGRLSHTLKVGILDRKSTSLTSSHY